MFTVQNIADATNLTPSFIHKCIKHMDNLLKPHYNKGEYNKIYFNQSGYVIFLKIKELKEEGLLIGAIKANLEKQLKDGKTTTITDSTNRQNAIEAPLIPTQFDMSIINKLIDEKEARIKERAEHEKRIIELETLSNHLKDQLLYLTDGKSPEEYKNSWYQEQMEKQRLKEQLSNITDGKPPEELKKQLQQEQLDKQRIAWILKELENLEGIFSVVNYFKRKKLYKELKDLMNKQADTTPNEQ
jgi:uncharacterized protein with ATP-grasp and redox domains